MSIKGAIYEHLADDASIAALVGTRIYPGGAPHKDDRIADTGAAFPYIIYGRTSNQHVRHMTGASGFAQPRFEVTCWDTDDLVVEELAEHIRNRLDHFRGTMGTVSTADVRVAMLDSDSDGLVSPTDADDLPIHSRVLEFLIWHTETVPTYS